MRSLLISAATLALAACGGGSATNNAAATTTTNQSAVIPAPAAAALPAPADTAGNTAAAEPNADQELAQIQRSNAEDATADARGISSEKDPDARAANCVVFLGISRDQGGSGVGFDDAAMRQAQDQWKSDLRRRFSQQEMDQLTGSSVNMLIPAEAKARDAASRWCVENAPEIDPAG